MLGGRALPRGGLGAPLPELTELVGGVTREGLPGGVARETARRWRCVRRDQLFRLLHDSKIRWSSEGVLASALDCGEAFCVSCGVAIHLDGSP